MNVFAFYRTQLFINNIKNAKIIDNDLVPYFHIQNSSFNPFNHFNIYFENKENYCLLTIKYYIKPKFNYLNILGSLNIFCYDICCYTNEYITEYLYLKFKILFSTNYPTDRCYWEFYSIDSSIPYNSREHGNMTLYNYYDYITEIYNNSNYENLYSYVNRFSLLNVENEVLSFILYIHCINNCLLDYCYQN